MPVSEPENQLDIHQNILFQKDELFIRNTVTRQAITGAISENGK